MTYKFNYDKDFIKSINKTKKEQFFLSLSYSLGFIGITLTIIMFFINLNFKFILDKNLGVVILFLIVTFFILFLLCYKFHSKLFNKIIDNLMFVDTSEQFITLNNEYMLIGNKNVQQKIYFTDIISAVFSDEFVTIKIKNNTLFIPTNFENGAIFSEILANYLDS